MRVAAVANAGDADDGFVGARLDQLGATFLRYHRDDPFTLQRCEEGIDLLILLGSDWSVYDNTHAESVRAERALVRRAQRRGLPVLGICFGGQLIASTLGLHVAPTNAPEIGWRTIDTDNADVCPEGPWFQYHFDRWTDNDAVRSIAQSASGPQAFWYGRTLGVQFHPEVTPKMAEQWLHDGRSAVQSIGEDVDQIMTETRHYEKDAEQRCNVFVDRFLAMADAFKYPVQE